MACSMLLGIPTYNSDEINYECMALEVAAQNLDMKYWSANRIVDWYDQASISQVWDAVNPVISKYPAQELATMIGVSKETIYSYRKKLWRAKKKPRLDLFIKLLTL